MDPTCSGLTFTNFIPEPGRLGTDELNIQVRSCVLPERISEVKLP